MPSSNTGNRDVRTHVELSNGLRFSATFPDFPDTPRLTIDEAPPLGVGQDPDPATLLATAVAGCLAASLTFCLHKARIEPERVAADAVAHISRNDQGRLRIGGIDVDLTVDLSDDDAARFARCESLFESFCTVTESVRQGIPVTVRRHVAEAKVAAASPRV